MLSFAVVQPKDKQHHNDATDDRCEKVPPVKSVAVAHIGPLLNTASDCGCEYSRPDASEQINALKISGQSDQSRQKETRKNVIFLVHHNRYHYASSKLPLLSIGNHGWSP